MAKNPTLIVMAAGMGSRYGGLKQIDPVTDKGEIIIDFSLYDALMAGFEDVVFIIKKEMEEDVRALIDEGAGGSLDIKYAYQSIDDVLRGATVPEGREKPWGTGHAVLAARKLVDGPFAVINADDYYGPAAYQLMREYLAGAEDDDKLRYAMVGYLLSNTITEHGSVTRGVCRVDGDGRLADIEERYNITRRGEGISYEDGEGRFINMPPDTTVSMNFWGFTESFMGELEAGLTGFFEKDVPQNPAKAEYLLPSIVGRLVTEGEASVKVMYSRDRWYGVTYKEDKERVMAALQSMKDRGMYPDKLW
ncbi:MAG: nucleotidyltransferase [Clostridiales Family XIII bacterium]|jgi:dTDP-glucose pyrophosphorylase|nr:nucleotidyltransferase [Clostridiales Family XIII bacterium]